MAELCNNFNIGSPMLNMNECNRFPTDNSMLDRHIYTCTSEAPGPEQTSGYLYASAGSFQASVSSYLTYPYLSPSLSASYSPSTSSDTLVDMKKGPHQREFTSNMSPPTDIDDQASVIASESELSSNMSYVTSRVAQVPSQWCAFPSGTQQALSQVSDMGESLSDARVFQDTYLYGRQTVDCPMHVGHKNTLGMSAMLLEYDTSTLVSFAERCGSDPDQPDTQCQHVTQKESEMPAQSYEEADTAPFVTTKTASPPSRTSERCLKAPVTVQPLRQCERCQVEFNDDVTPTSHTCKPLLCLFDFAGCDARFRGKNEWKRHIQTQHIGSVSYVCPLCHTKEFCRKDLFSQHYQRMHLLTESTPSATLKDFSLDMVAKLKAAQVEAYKTNLQIIISCTKCPVPSCEYRFPETDSWAMCLEHVARHLENPHSSKKGQNKPRFTPETLQSFVNMDILERLAEGGWKLGPRSTGERSRNSNKRVMRRTAARHNTHSLKKQH